MQHKRFYDITHVPQRDFTPDHNTKSLKSLSLTPNTKQVSACEQEKIVLENRESGKYVKVNCGLYGQGAKASLDYSYQVSPRINSGNGRFKSIN